MGYRCIQCGFTINTLYFQYSLGNIRLMKCENCKAVADEYIECEIMIIVIDIILHKPQAYRHLLYNVINQEAMKFQVLETATKAVHSWIIIISNKLYGAILLSLQFAPSRLIVAFAMCSVYEASAAIILQADFGLLWKLAVIFLLFDASYMRALQFGEDRYLILESSKGKLGSSMSYSSLVSMCCKMLIDVCFGNFMFLLTFFFMVKMFLHISISVSRCNDILLGLLISCYSKIFLIAMTVWEFPSSVIFIIELFCLSSNAVALKVMTESSMSRCVWTCFSAYAIKLFFIQAPELILLGKLMQGWSQMPFTLSLKSVFI